MSILAEPFRVSSHVIIAPPAPSVARTGLARCPLVKLMSLFQTSVSLAVILDAPMAFFELSIQVIIAPSLLSEMITGLMEASELGSPLLHTQVPHRSHCLLPLALSI